MGDLLFRNCLLRNLRAEDRPVDGTITIQFDDAGLQNVLGYAVTDDFPVPNGTSAFGTLTPAEFLGVTINTLVVDIGSELLSLSMPTGTAQGHFTTLSVDTADFGVLEFTSAGATFSDNGSFSRWSWDTSSIHATQEIWDNDEAGSTYQWTMV